MAATIATASSNQITVSCVNHHQILFNGLCNLFLNKQKFDCEMEHNGRSIRVHRILMDVFMSPESVQLHTAPDLTPPADPDDPDSNSLDLLVEFLYRGRVNVYKEQLPGLLKVAKVCKFYMLVGAVQAAIKRENQSHVTPVCTKKDQADQLTSKLHKMVSRDEESDSETENEDNLTESDKGDPELQISEMELPTQNKTYSRKKARQDDGLAAWSGDNSRTGSDETSIRHDSDHSTEDEGAVVHPGSAISASRPSATATTSIDLPPVVSTTSINLQPAAPVIFSGVHPSWSKELGAYQCSVCPKTFSRIGLLNYHAKIHGERSFLCQYCSKGFKRKYDVVVHLRTHRNEGLFDEIPAGDVSDQLSPSHSAMATRRPVQHIDRPKMNFPCSACGVSCNSRHDLKEHIMSDHTCSLCAKNFISKAALDLHSRSHDTSVS